MNLQIKYIINRKPYSIGYKGFGDVVNRILYMLFCSIVLESIDVLR